ncbi:MAG: hypothetical protein ACTHNK_19970 [Thermomicrobiales bacterium]
MSHDDHDDELARRRRMRSGEELRTQLRALHERHDRASEPLDLDPRSAYELLTRQMVSTRADELREIRQRVNGLIFLTIGAVLADIVMRITR